ncbi:hypothetical protein M0802_003801 [Mischocyttarus mexicanus]|nr:hypothetical protein M0802_003801 [Mischocyttarus mexicanus]
MRGRPLGVTDGQTIGYAEVEVEVENQDEEKEEKKEEEIVVVDHNHHYHNLGFSFPNAYTNNRRFNLFGDFLLFQTDCAI